MDSQLPPEISHSTTDLLKCNTSEYSGGSPQRKIALSIWKRSMPDAKQESMPFSW